MNKFISKGKTKIVEGTILAPENAGLRFIVNFVGLSGKFDAPVDLILTKKYANVKSSYKEWHATRLGFKPGEVRDVAVNSDTWVKSLLVRDNDGKIDEKSLETAVKKLATQAKYERASVHVSTLLTTEAPSLSKLLKDNLIDEGVTVYFYEEPKL